MHENTPRDFELQVVSRDQIRTELGTIIKSEVVYKGNPHTIYSTPARTEYGFAEQVEEVVATEQLMQDPNTIRNLADRGTTPEQFVEERSQQFIENLRTGTLAHRQGRSSALLPVIRQRALSTLYEQAKQEQNPQ